VNRIKEVNDSAGGKGLNETRILHQLKLDVTATGIIAGQNGDHLIDALNREGIKHNFYKLSYDQTRICVNANDYKNHKITELLEPGPTIKEQDTLTFLAFFKKLVKGFDIVSLAGSLPNGLKPNFYGKLISICRAQKIKVFLDTSNQALIQNLSSKPDFIKPNIDEIRQIMKVKDFNQAKAITFAKR
jgi:tagatose 6-phosphate kinase